MPTSIVVGNCNDSGIGSLRETIRDAANAVTIDMTQLSCAHITLTSGALEVAQALLTVLGPGADALTIDGGNTSAVFNATGSDTLTITALSIVNGRLHRDDNDSADATGGCLHGEGNIVLNNVNVSHCTAIGDGHRSALGGAVWARGRVSLQGSTISGNTAQAQGSAYASGGAVYALGGMTQSYSTLSDNLVSTAITAQSFGGGAFVRGSVFVLQSTISGNSADRSGGLDLDDNTGHAASIIDSTISGNAARVNGGVFARPPLVVANSTIAFNTATFWADGNGNHFAAGVHVIGTIRIDSSIVSNNVNSAAPTPTSDLTGGSSAILSGDHNNIMACDLASAASVSTGDPGLLPLRDNGGRTKTHMPTLGTWNAGGGNNVVQLSDDQRGQGFARDAPSARIDIGAVQIDDIFTDGFQSM